MASILSKESVHYALDKQMTITGRLKKIIYPRKGENVDTFFKVIIITASNNQEIKVVGNMNVVDNFLYNFTGKFTEDSYGTSFKIDFPPEIYKEKSRDRASTIDYLSSRLFEGIGPKRAEMIYDKFGDDSANIVENHPEQLIGVIKGITSLTVAAITSSFNRNYRYREIYQMLSGEGVTPHMVDLIFERYGSDACDVIRTDPYRLSYDIKGFGFKKADKIALSVDDRRYHSIERIQAAIIFSMKEFVNSTGGLFMYYRDIERSTNSLLNTHSDVYDGITFLEKRDALSGLISNGDVIVRYDNNNEMDHMDAKSVLNADSQLYMEDSKNPGSKGIGQYYLCPYYYSERGAVIQFVDLYKSDNIFNFSENTVKSEIEKIESEGEIRYSSKQREAILNAMTYGISIITGGPGTGKTFAVNAIKRIFESLTGLDNAVALCAPTGKAANRMADITDTPASTIHRLLEFDGETGRFKRNEENPLEYSLLIIDEASMIGLSLFHNLIAAIPKGRCKVVIVGDADQLPSVEPGNVLNDLIMSSKFPVTRLDIIYRQSHDSNIVYNAHEINECRFIDDLVLKTGSDFEIMEVDANQPGSQITDAIVSKYSEEISRYSEVQVLTPTREHNQYACVNTLNPLLEEKANEVNKDNVVFKDSNNIYRIGDRIMQMKNDYSKGVFNGETGTIVGTRKEGNTTFIAVRFDQDRTVYYQNPSEFILAYATTIHKSQGSEYECIIMPILDTDIFSLSRKLIYTGITRGKKKVDLIVSSKALECSLSEFKNRSVIRNTNMEKDLRKYYNTGYLQLCGNSFTDRDSALHEIEQLDLLHPFA